MTDIALPRPRPRVLRTLFALSLLGPLIKDAREGGDNSLMFFTINLVLVWVLSGFLWGIAGVLAIAYLLVPTAFAFMLGIMLFSGK
ncbi:MAG: hypothetical protein HWE25_03705 [Alphaproteobacteria bacterium]|nr:hypothetical protein [Alphaproteobacteria bacterium]